MAGALFNISVKRYSLRNFQDLWNSFTGCKQLTKPNQPTRKIKQKTIDISQNAKLKYRQKLAENKLNGNCSFGARCVYTVQSVDVFWAPEGNSFYTILRLFRLFMAIGFHRIESESIPIYIYKYTSMGLIESFFFRQSGAMWMRRAFFNVWHCAFNNWIAFRCNVVRWTAINICHGA